tara:strand:+ start:622 stop:723 length:102 start_codon:yes stop_codon:yes gene_type:complete
MFVVITRIDLFVYNEFASANNSYLVLNLLAKGE